MSETVLFLFNSALLGIGLAMDALSVSLANGMNEPTMKRGKMCLVAGMFGGFQGLMPLIGWACVHTFLQYFTAFERFIPFIALALLLYIGIKMLVDGIRGCEEEKAAVGFVGLLIQGVATSIDALSVGFTIADYGISMAATACLLIAAITFAICYVGIAVGKKFGTVLSDKATIFGGVILIIIGIEIFLKGILQ